MRDWMRTFLVFCVLLGWSIMPINPQLLGKLEHSQKVLETPPSGHPTPAKLPSRNPTRSFWIDSSPDANPLARHGSQDPLPSKADVCIIGAGITGVGVAYHLIELLNNASLSVKHPLSIAILEARDFCSGATGRNGGHLTPAAFLEFAQRQALFDTVEAIKSYKFEQHTASLLVKIIEENGWASDVDLVEGGHINLLFTEKEAENAHKDFDTASQAQLNLDGVEWLSKEELEEEYGAPYSGFREPGNNVWPLKLVTKLYQHAQAHAGQYASLSLHTRTPVTAVTHETTDNSSTYTVVTNRGSISCSRVVHATNAYASYLLPFLAGPNGIIPTRGQVMATRASVGTDQIKIPSWSANEGFAYWFPRPVKHDTEKPLIIIGGGREAVGPRYELYVDDDSETHPLVGKVLREFLPSIFEGKYDPLSEPEMEWTGIMGFTKMGDPFVGSVADLLVADPNRELYKKQYIAAGYTGHGMPRAFGCAEVLAQMILAEISDKKWKEPDWLPQRYLTWNRRVE
ncbi:FAD dependent oxidoreductase-domain-containing protein [Suillus fuscotomentosus]|uniref:FAD dependent oxidoreductase-domain-containing protein n=1 Tax=Suillus fuscotomentosus TaxID=1912939 RepID=A0AAD4HHS5_9AGAM|nr:FAD dependent oxidoreductase-domain-containing protein [Suillus fuscotomentosus]KAG1897088.1 FAD dependent oxidoreductase-domain-containing protein [Suillus fuscotomentosus]